MKYLYFILIPFVYNLNLYAAFWYASNTSSGTASANSWGNKSSVSAFPWGSVAAGDTVWIDGGVTNLTYTNAFYPTSGKSGTSGAWIWMKFSQEAGHNGRAIFEGVGAGPSSTSRYFGFEGARDPTFVNPTNRLQVLSGSTAITNNCGIWIRNLVGTTLQDTDPVVWYFSVSPKDLLFSYIEVSGLTNSACGAGCDWKGTVFYVNGNGSVSSNVVFQYMNLHDNVSQQFSANGYAENGFDNFTFKFGIITQGGEDHFEIGSGWTIRDSLIGPVNGQGKSHTDFFQMTGNYIKIYNNDIQESANSIFRAQTYPDVGIGLRHSILFFNNLVTEKVGRAVNGGTKTEPFTFVHFDPIHPAMISTLSNIIVANNLFYGSITNDVDPLNPTLALNAAMNFTKGAVIDGYITNCLFANNGWINKHKGVNFPATTVAAGTNGYVVYSTNSVIWDWNIHANDPTKTWLTTPRNVSYLDVSASVESHSLRNHNRTNYPSFVDPAGDNFELLSTDIAFLNAGTNLASIFDFDSLNRPRNVGGAWDIGPLESQGYYPPDGVTHDLLTLISFEDSFTNNFLTDNSGNGNHAYRYGRPGSVYPTNFPTQIAVATGGGGVHPSTYAGDFRWNTNSDYGLYNRDGSYGAITNVKVFTNLSRCTIMVRARYQTTRRIDNSYDYSQDGNACLISGGTSSAVLGSWDLGRFNQAVWLNNTRFYLVTNANFGVPQVGSESDLVFGKAGKVVFNFPDNGFSNNGDTTNYHHYCVTFNAGVIKTYFDGVSRSTNDVSAVLTKITIGWNNSVSASTAFIGIGCDTHGGTPALEDETGVDYPNNGFFNGAMDDVRIYAIDLTAEEIAGINSGNPPASGGGGSNPTSLKQFRQGRIIGNSTFRF